jgi:hypothetical protein
MGMLVDGEWLAATTRGYHRANDGAFVPPAFASHGGMIAFVRDNQERRLVSYMMSMDWSMQ